MLLHHDHVLDTDSELSVLVVARLVRDTHTLHEFHITAAVDSLRSFVHVEHTADSMTRPMAIVKSRGPQILPRQHIHMHTSDTSSLWPDDSFQVEYAHKHSRVGFFLEGGWCLTAEMRRPGNIRRPIVILPATIEEVDLIVVQKTGFFGGRGVVDDGAVRADRGDGLEGEAAEVVVLLLEVFED